MSKFDNYTLNGEYKVDVYNKENELVNTTDYFHNFITSTGLSYPRVTGFADCFYYLSLGSGTATNSVLTTTGLQSPIPNYQYLSTGHFFADGFGTSETAAGVSFYRAWRLPTSEAEDLFQKDFSFSELMTSPGSVGSNRYAFSRVVKSPEINVLSGQHAVVNYRLNLTTNTGLNYFKSFIALKSQNNDDGLNSHLGWHGLSGIYRQVHDGLRRLEYGKTDNDDPIGMSHTPSFGMPLEPYCPAKYLVGVTQRGLFCNLSDNNTQFMFNEASGGLLNTGLFLPWNTGAKVYFSGVPGVAKYQYGLNAGEDATEEQEDRAKRFVDLRYKSINPNPTDFSKDLKSTSIVRFDGEVEVGKIHVFTPADRSRYVTRKLSWGPLNIQFDESFQPAQPQKYSSMVFGDFQKTEGPTEYYPGLDILFGTSSGYVKPPFNTGDLTIDSITGGYPFQNSQNLLSMSFKLSWCAPCDGADDCDEGTNNCC